MSWWVIFLMHHTFKNLLKVSHLKSTVKLIDTSVRVKVKIFLVLEKEETMFLLWYSKHLIRCLFFYIFTV